MTSTTACPDCGKLFASLILRNLHIKRTHTEAQYTCAECSKSFKRKDKLQEHISTHKSLKKKKVSPPQKNFECSICHGKFTTKRSLTHHEKLKHQEDDERTSVTPKAPSTTETCQDCGKIFASSVLRNLHIKRTHTEARYTCAKCSKSFKRKDRLQEHIFSHETLKKRTNPPQKNFECNICHNKFTAKCSLTHHIKSKHLGERTSGCSTCGKTFTKEQNRKNHEHFSCPYKFILIPTQPWSVTVPQ